MSNFFCLAQTPSCQMKALNRPPWHLVPVFLQPYQFAGQDRLTETVSAEPFIGPGPRLPVSDKTDS